MKKLITTAVCSMAAVAAFGQGTFNFISTVGGTAGVSPDNTIFLSDGKTPADSPYQAEVAAGVGTTLSALTLYPASITPVTGGYIFGSAFNLTGAAAASTVAFDILVWNPANGSTYAAAVTAGGITGSSGVIQGYVTGGNGSPPAVAPSPAFNSFNLSGTAPIPEPTTLALGAMGLGAALLIRRRK